MTIQMTEEIQYFLLLVGLLIIPKILLRFRIPSGLTAMALGFATTLSLGWFQESQLVGLLATLGITSLFLFAGLEVDYFELKNHIPTFMKQICKSAVLIGLCSFVMMQVLNINLRPSIILALGLLTPSTGFILNSLSSFKFSEEQRFWISSKAIASEILAILIMFFVLQSDSVVTLSVSFGALVLMIIIVPVLFRMFLKLIAPFAPNSEATFLVLLAFVCGVITSKMGTYYLIGAFIVGVVAAQFRHFVKTENSEKMFYAIGFFSALLIPFYFFRAGLNLANSGFNMQGLIYGLIFSMIFIPVRYASVLLSIRLFLKDYWKDRLEIAVSLMPTLIFGLVTASVLKQKFMIDNSIVVGLVIYTVISSIVPTLILEKAPPEEYDAAFVISRK